jgi:RNA polymerase primary sigma factor
MHRPRAASARSARAVAARQAPAQAEPSPDATDLYLQGLAGSHPLTREGEAEIGRRIEAGERDALSAIAGSRLGLGVLSRLGDEVREGKIEARELLLNGEAPEADAMAAQLDALLARAHALLAHPADGARASENGKASLGRELAEIRLDPAVVTRIEERLREALAGATPEAASEIEATLSALARSRRTVARAKAELVQANLRLVVATARHYQGRGVPLLDLVQEGNLGLMRAADKFDYRRGYRFGTYASWWIKQSIERALLYQGKDVRMPVHLSGSRRRVLTAQRTLAQEQGRDPSQEEIAERSGLPLDKVRAVRALSLHPVSLDAPVGDEGESRFGDFLASEGEAPDEALARRRMHEQTSELLDSLTPREREVLRLRYGLEGESDHTLEEIGRSFSLSRERIRQIESKALAKLRQWSQELDLLTYLTG